MIVGLKNCVANILHQIINSCNMFCPSFHISNLRIFLLGLILNGSHVLIGYFPWIPPQGFTENTFLLLPLDLLFVGGFSFYFSASFHFLMTNILAVGFSSFSFLFHELDSTLISA